MVKRLIDPGEMRFRLLLLKAESNASIPGLNRGGCVALVFN